MFITSLFILRYTISQHKCGNRYIWSTSLVRFNPHTFEEINPRPVTVTDYFASGPTNAIAGYDYNAKW